MNWSSRRSPSIPITLGLGTPTRRSILQFQGRVEESVAEFERALALDPSNVITAANGWASYYQFLGEFDKCVEYLDKAIWTSPVRCRDRLLVRRQGVVQFRAEANYDQAIELARRAIAIKPNYNQFSHLLLVAALALTGHDAEAREALQRYLALPSTGPLKTIAAWKAHWMSQSGDARLSR